MIEGESRDRMSEVVVYNGIQQLTQPAGGNSGGNGDVM
jgi:hypothetical protein